MSHSQFQSKRFILRRAWLNLWDERMTTGRINQVASHQISVSTEFNLPHFISFHRFAATTHRVAAANSNQKKYSLIRSPLAHQTSTSESSSRTPDHLPVMRYKTIPSTHQHSYLRFCSLPKSLRNSPHPSTRWTIHPYAVRNQYSNFPHSDQKVQGNQN